MTSDIKAAVAARSFAEEPASQCHATAAIIGNGNDSQAKPDLRWALAQHVSQKSSMPGPATQKVLRLIDWAPVEVSRQIWPY